jgi:hypothetical protein
MMQGRSIVEAYLIQRASMTPVEAAALSDLQLAEHVLGVNGCAVVSVEIANEIRCIEALGYNVPPARLDAAIFALYSGVLAEYRRPLALA